MLVDDLPDLMPLQERGAVTALAQVFPQDTHPFPREAVRDRWRRELEEPDVAAYVATTDPAGDLVAFAARRGEELLHFGTAVETWGSGLATWLHDKLVATYPTDVDRLRLRVFVENGRARRFYEKLGWLSTGRESRSTFAPYPAMIEYTLSRVRQDVPMGIQIAQDAHADQVLTDSPFALLMGMLLDQQFPMERAFAGPAKVLDRFGTLEPATIAAADPEEFAALCAVPPAVHRFPGSMAARIQTLAALVVEEYDGHTDRLWTEADSGRELMRRLQALPGFGKQKAQIFTALLAKQLGVRPDGWETAAGDYAEEGSHRSVADVVDQDSLDRVRAFKQEKKRAAAQ